jgi:ATP-dependent DNA helicase RecG
MTLDSQLSEISGIGEATSKKFGSVGIETVGDLFNYYPRRYEDYSNVSTIAKLRPGAVSIKAVIKQASGRYIRPRLHITEAVASDATGSIRLIWFNQPYRAASLKTDQEYYISGVYELRRSRFSIMNPSIELYSDFPANTARILAVYKENKDINSRQIRLVVKKVSNVFDSIPEILPKWLIKEHELMDRSSALRSLHLPKSSEDLEIAKHRLGFEEVFQLSLASLINKQANQNETAYKVPFKQDLAKNFVASLPFKLTDAQRVSIWQIYQDMQSENPMNRLIEGDVGTGKTVVAAMAALMVLADNRQVALMAPTELLARQHADSIHKLLSPLGYDNKVALLVGSMKAPQKIKAYEAISSGAAGFIIGTQALIQDKLDMSNLDLVVVDEQHRFGVEQRKALIAKAGHTPHLLSLSATPIPRSLALTLYGELDISILDQKPLNRLPILTEIIAQSSRNTLKDKLKKELEKGRQVFVVCPSISESNLIDSKSVEKTFEQYTADFKKYKVGLLHGKLKPLDKQTIMEDFLKRNIDILVSTTVIEVGVDVANASAMVVESPERFGLAQLHQLRGRVGRSSHQGYCYLALDSADPPSKRLRALMSSNDGFKLAELDLNIRGPGAIYGISQHGALDLRVAQLSDTKLIASAVKAAKEFIQKQTNLLKYKELNDNVKRLRTVTNLN